MFRFSWVYLFADQKLLQRQLAKAGLAVLTANNGVDALDRLQKAFLEETKVDVCLMDLGWSHVYFRKAKIEISSLNFLEMPLMGGLEASKKIRELEHNGKLPGRLHIIAVTGNAREFFVTESHKAGMDGVITKPYRFPDIMSKLDSLAQSS